MMENINKKPAAISKRVRIVILQNIGKRISHMFILEISCYYIDKYLDDYFFIQGKIIT